MEYKVNGEFKKSQKTLLNSRTQPAMHFIIVGAIHDLNLERERISKPQLEVDPITKLFETGLCL